MERGGPGNVPGPFRLVRTGGEIGMRVIDGTMRGDTRLCVSTKITDGNTASNRIK
jgi:hypothetical protein